MTHRARRALLMMLCAMPLTLTAPAHAQKNADEEEVPDARLTGYQNNVGIGGGNALNYVIFGFIGVLTCGILFKNANRSHLD